MRIVCKLHREWGERIFVNNEFFVIDPNDGSVDVPEEAAAKLLQNKNKWVDPAAAPAPTPTTEDGTPLEPMPADDLPVVILKDPVTGRLLSDEEGAAELAKAHAAAAKENAAQAPVDDLEAASQVINQQHHQGHGGDREQASTDPLAAQIGDAKAAKVDMAIQASHDEPGDVDIEPEESPDDWPEVSMKNTVKQLDAVIERLLADGWELDLGDGKKADKLEAIEAAYDAMAAED